VIIDATRMCEVLVGLPDVNVLGVVDVAEAPVEVVIEQRVGRPRCAGCGEPARVKDRPDVALVDLPCFGRAARLVWRKHRWECPTVSCPTGSWTGEDVRIARHEWVSAIGPGGGRRCRSAAMVAASPRSPPISSVTGTR